MARECKKYGQDWKELHSNEEWVAKNRQLLNNLNKGMFKDSEILQAQVKARMEEESVGFGQSLLRQGLRIVETADDGNCLFRAIAPSLEDGGFSH